MKYTFVLLIVASVYLSGAQGKSECVNHRTRELRPGGNIPVEARLIPNCDDNGDYKPLQCHGGEKEKKRACQCWLKNGDIIKAPSFSLRSCSCILAKHEAEKTRGATLPTCENDGKFARKQCVGSKCDCVNQETGKKESC